MFGLKLYGELIPYEKTPVSLGIVFNECMSFENNTKVLKAKCAQRLNIIKILSHKSWKLNKKTLVSLYKSLIGSLIDYSAFACVRYAKDLNKTIQAIQNMAVRSIYKIRREAHTPTEELCRISGLELVITRMSDLNSRFFKNAKKTKNPLIQKLVEEYREKFLNKPIPKTLLCDYIDLFHVYL